MNGKKGVMGYVALIITFTIGALLLANLLIPQTVSFDTLSTVTGEAVVRDDAPNSELVTLANDEISLVTFDGGLVLNTNYTIYDADAGIINFTVANNATYNASYSYEPDGYSDDAGTRAIGGLIALAGIVGLLYFVFRGFGLA